MATNTGAPPVTVGRRVVIAAVGGTLASLACHGTARFRDARSSDARSEPSLPYPPPADAGQETISGRSAIPELNRRFVTAHGELRGLVAAVLEAGARDDERLLRPRAAEYVDRLLRHHRAEDAFIFPAFRAAGRLRSSDVAFLDARDAEHRDVHRLCVELRRVSLAGGSSALPTPARRHITRLASELESLTRPHFDIEEATLTTEHLATLLTAREAITLFDDIRRRWNSR
jgi:hypothetical protein